MNVSVVRKLLRERECRLCGRVSSNGHHLVYRSQGGADDPDNIIPLCGSGTTGCHGKIHAHDHEARLAVGFSLRDEERRYLVRKFGDNRRAAAWLERVYGTPEEAWIDV